MKYREFGNLGFKISTFGMGCMRLPTLDGDHNKIDEKEAVKMVRYAIDSGVNYFDTAYIYHGGNSEKLLSIALKDGYREKIKLATKLPSWMCNSYEDFDKFLDLQMNRMQIDYLDFYLMHGLDSERWHKLKELGIVEFINKAKASGKLRHVGFSFHGALEDFKEIIDDYNWEMCQIQLNFLDYHYQAGLEGLKYAAAKGIPVVIMEPLKGGGLANNIPEDVQQVWNEAKVARKQAEWAFRWICDFPEVTVVLSGVSNMEQLKDNIRIFSDDKPLTLNEEEHALFTRVQEIYENRTKVGCTGCFYCLPCPSGVEIPEIFKLYNNASVFNKLDENKGYYIRLAGHGRDASKCVECGNCENACPQHISIIEKLKEANTVLSSK